MAGGFLTTAPPRKPRIHSLCLIVTACNSILQSGWEGKAGSTTPSQGLVHTRSPCMFVCEWVTCPWKLGRFIQFIHSPLIKHLLSTRLHAMYFVVIILISLSTVPSHSVFILLFIYLFLNIYLFIWLRRVLVAARGSFVAACGIFSCSIRTLSCGMWDLVL